MASSRAAGRASLSRWLIATGIGFLSISSFVLLHEFFSVKFHLTTGQAQWVRPERSLRKTAPEVFAIAKTFDVPADRQYVRIKVAATPGYAVALNGREIAASAGVRGHLDVYDVTERARTGRNTVSITVRDPRGAGAVLAAADFGHSRENVLVSDDSWRVNNASGGTGHDPLRSLGRPPSGPWGYPKPVARELLPERTRVIAARSSRSFATTLPEVRVVSGVSILAAQPVRALAFDFGSVQTGRLRLTRTGRNLQMVRFRLLAGDEDPTVAEGPVRATVFAAGESSVTIPESLPFQWAVVYAPGVTAELVTTD